MHGLTGNECQKLWDYIDQSTIHAALHEAMKAIIKALHLNCLADQEDDESTCLRFVISNSGINTVSTI